MAVGLQAFYQALDDFLADAPFAVGLPHGHVLDVGVAGPVADAAPHADDFTAVQHHQKAVADG